MIKKILISGLVAISVPFANLQSAELQLEDSPIQPFLYGRIAPIQKTMTKLGQALQSIKPGPETMMVTAGMGMMLGDPTFATFDPDANTGVYLMNNFTDGKEPTVIVLLKVGKDSPVVTAMEKNMKMKSTTKNGWTILTNHADQLKEIPDLAPLIKHTSQKAATDLQVGVYSAPLLANSFIKEGIKQANDTIEKLEDKDLSTSAAAMMALALDELADLESLEYGINLENDALAIGYTMGFRPGSELSKMFQAPGADVPEAKLVSNEGLISGSFAYKTESYFGYMEHIMTKLKPGLKGGFAETIEYMDEYLKESRKALPDLQTGAVNFTFDMKSIIPQPVFNAVLPMKLNLEEITEYQKKEKEISLKIIKLMAKTPGLDEVFGDVEELLEEYLSTENEPKKLNIAGLPALYFEEKMPSPDLFDEEEETAFGYYAAVKEGLLISSTSKEEMAKTIQLLDGGKSVESATPTKLAPGEFMKGYFNVKPYFSMIMGMTLSEAVFGEEKPQENPIAKELKNLQIAPWPITVTQKGANLNTDIKISYASLKTLTEFSEKMMKASFGGEEDAVDDIEASGVDMSKVKIPMELRFQLSNGGHTTLAKLTKGKKAVLLDFWASWCGPCMALMPELKKKAEALGPQGIVVAGMNTEAEPDTAEKTRKNLEIKFPWLVEPEDAPLSDLLEIDSIPRMILISPEGKVLYNGHPQDPRLNAALAQLGVNL